MKRAIVHRAVSLNTVLLRINGNEQPDDRVFTIPQGTTPSAGDIAYIEDVDGRYDIISIHKKQA